MIISYLVVELFSKIRFRAVVVAFKNPETDLRGEGGNVTTIVVTELIEYQ